MGDKYSPRSFAELAEDPACVTWINEPPPPDNVATLVRPKQRSLHAVLVENLNSTRALQRRLELGVHVPRHHQREIVRLLYVATQHQAKALAAVVGLE
jgi:hypothetical protein